MSLAPAQRDLSSTDLWYQSLERSQRRRELSELARKHQSRQKSASLAVTAAMATTPIAPTLNAFKGKGPAKATTSSLNLRLEEKTNGGERVLLERGMTNTAVAQVQDELKIVEDGVFGPVTELAVEQFQRRHHLTANGKVDVRTWLKLFPDGMVVFDPKHENAQLATHAPDLGAAGGPAGPSSNLLPATGAPESDNDLRTARNQAAAGGAPEGAEADGGILPDGDAPHKGHKRHGHGKGHHSSSHQRTHSADKASGVTKDGSGSGQSGSSRSRGNGSGGGGSTGHSRGPVGGPIGVAHGIGSKDEMIAAMIAAANRIDRAGYSYSWGGGHNANFSGPYDCSGAVSAVLHAAGLLNSPMVSGSFMRWGRPGPGAVTIYANAGHVYMSINGRFFGTTRANPGGGAGWFNGSRRAGFTVVHVPFESLHYGKSSKRVKSASTKRTQTRAASASRKPASQGGSTSAQTGGTSAGSQSGSAQAAPESAPSGTASGTGSGSAQAAPAQQAPAQQATPAQAAPQQQAPAEQAAPAQQAASAQAAPQQQAPAEQAAPAQAAPSAAAPAEQAPAQAAPAPEAAAPAPTAPAESAPAADAAAAAPEAAATAPAPEAKAPEAAPADAAPAAPEAPAAEAPSASAGTEAASGQSGQATEDKDGSAAEQSGTSASG
jgi:hypothetical protein